MDFNDIDFGEAMDAVGLRPINIDENTDFSKLPNPFRPLHPTLKKCACGFIGSKYSFEKHMEETEPEYESSEQFFFHHGEVPYYGE